MRCCLPSPAGTCFGQPPVLCTCRGVKIAADLKKQTGAKLKDFREALDKEEPAALSALRSEVEDFAKQVGRPAYSAQCCQCRPRNPLRQPAC